MSGKYCHADFAVLSLRKVRRAFQLAVHTVYTSKEFPSHFLSLRKSTFFDHVCGIDRHSLNICFTDGKSQLLCLQSSFFYNDIAYIFI